MKKFLPEEPELPIETELNQRTKHAARYKSRSGTTFVTINLVTRSENNDIGRSHIIADLKSAALAFFGPSSRSWHRP